MDERLILIRQSTGLTTRAFGERINLTGGAITNMEKGVRKVTDRTVSDICREFNINEEWLRTGAGEMTISLTRSQQIMKYTALLLKDTNSVVGEAIKNFIITYEQLDPGKKEFLDEIAKEFMNNMNKGEQ